ncbi:MAG: pilus assembly protein TadG-related protein [Dehalococcoidia bacterium]|nr:pilus assembly protein TadG-related protein [Dehalococcoidia bacterium]
MRLARLHEESGQSLILGTFSVLALLLVTAFSIDVGLATGQKANLQNAVDAAALAGASALPGQPDVALQRAQQMLEDNGITSTDSVTLQVLSTATSNDTLRAYAQRELQAQFASVAGINSISVSVDASARIGSAVGLDRFIPFAILDDSLTGLVSGGALTLVYNANDPVSGNSLAIAFPGNSGASDFRASISNGSSNEFCAASDPYPGCPTVLQSEPGNMVGPTRQGFDDLVQNTVASCDTYNEVFQPLPDDPARTGLNPACNPFPPFNVTGSKRVAILPVIQQLCSGRCDLPIVRFSLFFVQGVQCNGGSCQVDGLYASDMSGVRGGRFGAYDPLSAFNSVKLIE